MNKVRNIASPVLLTAFAIPLFLMTPSTTKASTVIGAVSVSASVSDLAGFPIGNLINQSGISDNYTSGVTDFDTFIASTTLSGNPGIGGEGGWASTTNNAFPVSIDFDFGSSVNLTRMALWNDVDFQALGSFEVFSSTDATFTSLTSLGSFVGLVSTVGSLAEVFDMTDTTTQYLRISGSPVLNLNGLLNIGEFAFEGTVAPVPIPAAFPLLLSALGWFGFLGWRRRRTAAA